MKKEMQKWKQGLRVGRKLTILYSKNKFQINKNFLKNA